MEYRKLPHGKHGEKLSVLGLGMGGIQKCSNAEIEQVIRTAVANGINFFELCAGGKNVYGWSRNPQQIKETFEQELKMW